ncbi:sodium channel protein Nach [Drosophila montana]|uniref:sodium channel protein Nach n=1 Tax=Drosophila montana TaxID=40370 RepID=UPI00313B72C5
MVSHIKERNNTSSEHGEEHDWWMELCRESAIHGMPYLARKDLHWIERVFWLAMIVAAAYYAIGSCLSQWQRFRDNPIVYEYEYLFALRSFPFMGVTLCTQFVTMEDRVSGAIVHNTWDMETNSTEDEVDYYREFLLVVNRLHYNNLETLAPYENDTTLENINFVELLFNILQKVLPAANQSLPSFAPTLTEMGLCQTTSQLVKFGNPYGKNVKLKVPPVRQCNSFANCQTTIKPAVAGTHVNLFMHDVNEVMLPQDRRTVGIDTGTETSYLLKVLLSSISAEDEVRNVPVAYRKCRYIEENYLKYYSPYHPSLCRLECRINVALDLCKCKPYFYAAGPKEHICSVKGMICLARNKWLDRNCDCLPLCKENSFIVAEELGQSGGGTQYAGANFERTIIIQQELPKMGMKRRVVFSTDQLIMSFGGAIGLFLGASFMTIYGLTYVILYYLVVKCKRRPQLQRDKSAPIKIA